MGFHFSLGECIPLYTVSTHVHPANPLEAAIRPAAGKSVLNSTPNTGNLERKPETPNPKKRSRV